MTKEMISKDIRTYKLWKFWINQFSIYLWKKVLFYLSDTFENLLTAGLKKSIDNTGKEWEC